MVFIPHNHFAGCVISNSWSQDSEGLLVAAEDRVTVSALVSRQVVVIVQQAGVCPYPVREPVL